MVNFLFVDPYLSEVECNVGLGYLCGVLKKHGHACRVVSCAQGVPEILDIVRAEQPDIVGFSIKSSTVQTAVESAEQIRKCHKGLIICGGPHITIDGEEFLKEHTCFDIGVCGEAEETILDIVNLSLGKCRIEDINGVIARNGESLLFTEPRKPMSHLDDIPFPDYTVFDIYSKGMKVYWICTSRGCPHRCIFCNVPSISGRKWRHRSVANIIEELEYAKSVYKGIQCVDIADDNFTLDVERAKEFCRQIIDRNLHIRWKCSNGIRADRIDRELVALMKESGCTGIDFGIESGSPTVFAGIHKGETLATIEESVKMVKDAGMRVAASFIIGLPGSDYHLDMESVNFAKKLNLDAAWFNLYCPFKKTEGYEMLIRDASVDFLHDWRNSPFMFHNRKIYCIFETDSYTCKQRIKAFMKSNLQLYNYNFVRDYSKPSWSPGRVLPLLALIVRYDGKNLFRHLARMAGEIIGHLMPS